MLELKTKWFTNSLAKQSMLNKDYILCHDGTRLFIIGYGDLTSSGKNTYNYEIKDNEKNAVLSSGENAYLDALTKIILGTLPKEKASKDKETKDNNTKAKQASKQGQKECLYLTFDEAFDKASNMLESYKDVAKMLGKYETKDAINLTLHLIKEAKRSEEQRIKEAKKIEELKALRLSLDIAKAQGNNMLVDAINEMIANKEKE